MTQGYLGIDVGTQGLSVVFADQQLAVLAVGEAEYQMVPGLLEGCYEQSPDDWVAALQQAMQALRKSLPKEHELQVLCIGISGQMHGEVLVGSDSRPLGPARLWCDSRNDAEGHELTERFGVKMPRRLTATRWLWTVRNRPEMALATRHMTTPAGWIAHQLTGDWLLGIGEASGMFPVDQSTLNYDERLLASFRDVAGDCEAVSLTELLPQVRRAGEDGGVLHSDGAKLLGLPAGIPVAPAEGDQPASMAGSLIGKAGMVSVSFGTSLCANSVGDRSFEGVSPGVDHFCAADGKPINMVWLQNGTTFMNCAVEMLSSTSKTDRQDRFATIMQALLEADTDCGGLLAIPFINDEPGIGIHTGGTGAIVGLNPANSTSGNVARAALLSAMFNLRLGTEELDRQGYPRTELVLAGGLAKTPETGQILADVFRTPVTLLESAEEGTAWGSAVLAGYRHRVLQGDSMDWPSWLESLASDTTTRFAPDPATADIYDTMYARYRKLLSAQPQLNVTADAVGDG
jgi:sugar (pentulose or hexulose) kinase